MVSQELARNFALPGLRAGKRRPAGYIKETWLVCHDCGRKYPIRDDIPVMLIDEGR